MKLGLGGNLRVYGVRGTHHLWSDCMLTNSGRIELQQDELTVRPQETLPALLLLYVLSLAVFEPHF
jgi:hypothetical protein